jgi:hypothetical protein
MIYFANVLVDSSMSYSFPTVLEGLELFVEKLLIEVFDQSMS